VFFYIYAYWLFFWLETELETNMYEIQHCSGESYSISKSLCSARRHDSNVFQSCLGRRKPVVHRGIQRAAAGAQLEHESSQAFWLITWFGHTAYGESYCVSISMPNVRGSSPFYFLCFSPLLLPGLREQNIISLIHVTLESLLPYVLPYFLTRLRAYARGRSTSQKCPTFFRSTDASCLGQSGIIR